MTKFHINPKTDRVNICRATVKCPISGEAEHYGSKEEAYKARETKLASEHGSFEALQKRKVPVQEPEISEQQLKEDAETRKVESVIYDFNLHHASAKDKTELIEKLIEDHKLPREKTFALIERAQAHEARLIERFEQSYREKALDIISQTPKELKRGMTVVIDDYGNDSMRIVKLTSVQKDRFGAYHISGNTVHDGGRYEPNYFSSWDISSVKRPSNVSFGKTIVQPEGTFNFIKDEWGKPRAKLYKVENGYRLEAKSKSKGKNNELFDQTEFNSPEEAKAYLDKWINDNLTVSLSA